MATLNLRKLRRLTGCSQAELATRAGINRGRISLAETGQLRLRPDEVKKLRAILVRAVACSTNKLQKMQRVLHDSEDSEIGPTQASEPASEQVNVG
jgi:transcriptional regulator with XRE-family HTH domain